MRKCVFVSVVLFMVSLAGSSAFAGLVPVLDQSQTSYDGSSRVYVTRSLCQTFTAGLTGNLTKISLMFDSTNYNELAPAVISIIGTVGGVPDGTNVLWTKSFDNLAQGWFDIDTSVGAPSLASGGVYGIEIVSSDPAPSSSPDDAWNTKFSTNPYVGGSLFENRGSGWVPPTISGTSYPNTDAAFKTYITLVPEPATISILGLGMISLFGFQRSRQ